MKTSQTTTSKPSGAAISTDKTQAAGTSPQVSTTDKTQDAADGTLNSAKNTIGTGAGAATS